MPAVLSVLPVQLGTILYRVVLPILLVAASGYVVQKGLKLDISTLSNVHFYCVMPAMVFASIVGTELKGSDAAFIVFFGFACIGIMGLLAWGITIAIRMRRDLRNATIMTAMMHNSGNFGIPLQNLAFAGTGLSDLAVSMQSFLLITQSIATFTVGILLAARGRARVTLRETLGHMCRFPALYAVAAGLVVAAVRPAVAAAVPFAAAVVDPLWQATLILKSIFVGLAIFTLGAQLATIRIERSEYPVAMTVAVRLLVSPIVAFALIRVFGLTGFPAKVLMIGTCNPTAINALLISLKFDNHPDFLARSVFYSTLFAPLTVTPVIFAAGLLFP
jgi:malate permease and related proteins